MKTICRAAQMLVFLGLLVLTGCVLSSTHNEVLEDLAACDQERSDLAKEMENWRALYEQEKDFQRAGSEDAQAAVRLVNEKIHDIQVGLPPMVQDQVDSRLNQLAEILSEEFGRLATQNAALNVQLEDATERLEKIQEEMATLEEMRGLMDEARARRAKLAGDFTKILGTLREWDRTRLNCKKCDEYLGLRRKKREELVRFHGQVAGDLSRLQAALSTE